MTVVLALVEHDDGVAAEPSLETLTFARRVADAAGADVHAVAFGEPTPATLGAYGVATVHAVRDERLAVYSPQGWAAALAWTIERLEPVAVAAPGTDRGHEVLAGAAARLGFALASNCVEVVPGDDTYTVTRQRWGGSVLEDASLTAAVKLFTVAPHALAARRKEGGADAAVADVAFELDEPDLRVRLVDHVPAGSGARSLGEAKVVVGGGRGVGSADGFAPLEELAALLGGVVGCSRAVTNQGWRPHTDQIGQTGTRIAPDLYVACGISGATQHMVGARGSKRILVINTDPEAPIMAQADHAVVGDLHQVVPAIVAELRRARGTA